MFKVILKESLENGSNQKQFDWGKAIGTSFWGLAIYGIYKLIDTACGKNEGNNKQKEIRKTDKNKTDLKIKEMEYKANLVNNNNQKQHERKIELEKLKQANWEKKQETKASSNAMNVESGSEEVEVLPTPPSTFAFTGKIEFVERPFYYKGGVNLIAAKSGIGKSRFTMQSVFNLCCMNVDGLFGEGSPDYAYACYYYDYEMRNGFDLRYRNQVSLLNFYRRDMSEEKSKIADVHSSSYLLKLMKTDLEMASRGDIIMVVDTVGNLSDVRNMSEVNKFVEGLQQLCNEYNKQPGCSLTFFLLQHLDEEKAKDKNPLEKADIRGSQQFNSSADQTILLGITRVDQCIRVKIAKNRYGIKQSDKVLLFKENGIFYKYLGEYFEEDVVLHNHEKKMPMAQFVSKYKPVSNPTYMHDKKTGRGRPAKLTKSICIAILKDRSQGNSKNRAAQLNGFTLKAYNQALKNFGLVDDYPDGNWKA